jgi:hypothetical protein
MSASSADFIPPTTPSASAALSHLRFQRYFM